MDEMKENGSSIVNIGDDNTHQEVSFKTLQNIYHEITGKSEELSRRYSKKFKVGFEDFRQLNTKIEQVCEQYNIQGRNCTVTVYHCEEQRQRFSSFDRFSAYEKGILSPTETIFIKYDFLILLPQIEKVQSYSIKVRLSSNVARHQSLKTDEIPRKLLRLIAGNNLAEINIEYIDYTVAKNFLTSIEDWFKALEETKKANFRQKIQQYSHFIPGFMMAYMGIFAGCVCWYFSSNFIKDEMSYTQIYNVSLATCCFIFVMSTLGKLFGKIAENEIDSVDELSYIKLNRGDENAIKNFISDNSKGGRNFVLSIVLSIFISILSSYLASLIL